MARPVKLPPWDFQAYVSVAGRECSRGWSATS
jgi:hypothetical protein